MTRWDWRKAKQPIAITEPTHDVGDASAREDQEILGEIQERRRKEANKLRRTLKKLRPNWLKTNEEVRAYRDQLAAKLKKD
ncbi:MAG TPA: hypothetical protein VGD66_14555 [Allosphingosinicella sp.]|jgi:hypothetical protein